MMLYYAFGWVWDAKIPRSVVCQDTFIHRDESTAGCISNLIRTAPIDAIKTAISDVHDTHVRYPKTRVKIQVIQASAEGITQDAESTISHMRCVGDAEFTDWWLDRRVLPKSVQRWPPRLSTEAKCQCC